MCVAIVMLMYSWLADGLELHILFYAEKISTRKRSV